MIAAPIPDNEEARQASLETMGLLISPDDPELDRITRLARKLFEARIVTISLLDNDRQFFKSRVNLPISEIMRDISFCGHAIENDHPFVIEDTLSDERFFDNPLVTDGPQIRAYLGVPISNQQGYKLGTLSVIDDKTRKFSDSEIETLKDLASWAETVIALRYSQRSQTQLLSDLDAAQRDALIDTLTGIWNRRGTLELLSREIAAAHVKRRSVGVFMMDIDHFKNVNDTYGHIVGDRVIKAAADVMLSTLREQDIVGRFGGEEFVCVLPGPQLEQMMYLGYKLCNRVREQCHVTTDDGEAVHVSVSVGATWLSPESQTALEPLDILKFADDALYEAKKSGRDTVRYVPMDANGALDFIAQQV